MKQSKALNVAKAVVDAGWDVEVFGRADRPGLVHGGGYPEHWSVVVTHRESVTADDFNKLVGLLEVVGLTVYFNPTGRGLFVQEAS